jgi:hypothetical protein
MIHHGGVEGMESGEAAGVGTRHFVVQATAKTGKNKVVRSVIITGKASIVVRALTSLSVFL